MLKFWCLFLSNNIIITEFLVREQHCVKSVRIQNFSGLYFPAFGLNTERYSVSLRIQSECWKIWTRKTLWIWTLFTQCKTTFFKYSFGDWWLSLYSKPTVESCFGKYPVNIYLLKINNRNTRKRCQKCLKLTIKTPERRHWYRFGVFIVNFEHISHLFVVSLLLLRTSKF